MSKLDPIQRLKDRYGNAIQYRIIQTGSGQTQPWIVEVLLSSVVIGRGEHAHERPAKKIAVKQAATCLEESGTPQKSERVAEQAAQEEPPHQKKFRKIFAQNDVEVLGHIKERLLVGMASDPWAERKPIWLKNLRRGTDEEDKRKIDLVAETDRGEIPVQIKSSLQGALKHAQESDIPVFVYATHWGRHTAYKRFLAWLENVYKLQAT